MVVTASNAPIDEPNANGWNNFFASVDFILNARRAGTYFVYQSSRNRGDVFVFASDEIREADVYSDEFSSSTPYVFGKMENGQLIARENKRRAATAASWTFEPFYYKHKVMGIKPYPGLDYSVFNLKDSDIKAVVHQSYHSNTHNCSDQKEAEPYSILAFVKQCEAMGIQVFLSDFPKERLILPIYPTTIQLIRLGAIPVYLPFESAYTKAVLAYNQKSVPPGTLMMR